VNSPLPSAQDFDFFGDHKGRIEADPELPDQAHILARVARQLVHKGGGAGSGDRAEVVDQLFAIHADPVIGDRQGARGFIGGKRYAIFGIAFG
jgi:CRISPR/Cas system endoribonuclease Cas6 (RAMP superfamily)